jgi:hypothetical protein
MIHGGIEEELMARWFSSIRVQEGGTWRRMAWWRGLKGRRLGRPEEGDDPRVGQLGHKC